MTSTLELYKKAGKNTAENNKRQEIIKAIKRKGYAEEVYWLHMTADEIRWEVDCWYQGDEPRDVLTVEYKEEYQAYPARVLWWEHMTPRELAEGLKV